MQTPGGALSEVVWHLCQLRRCTAAWGWFALVLAIHTMVTLVGGVDALPELFIACGLSRDAFLTGNFWQLGSYGLLHGNWWHAGLNAGFVLWVGARVETMVGARVQVRAVVAGVLGGGLFHLVLGSGLLIGLSGGCLALLLLLTTLSPQSRMFPLPVSGKSLGWGIMLAAGILCLMDPALDWPGLSAAGRWLAGHGMGGWFQLGHACHFGGGLAGWCYGRWLLRPTVTLQQLRRERARREMK